MPTAVTAIYDLAHPDRRETAVVAATRAARRGRLVVLPVDAAYGIGTDAFAPAGTRALLAAKERGRGAPLPVLVGRIDALDGVLVVPPSARALARAFWPGPLTLVGTPQPSLAWDLGADDPSAPVSVRMPLHPVTLRVLREVGPMAVAAITDADGTPVRDHDACLRLVGAHASVVLAGGPLPETAPSTVVDVTGPTPVLLRAGALGIERLRRACPEISEGATVD